MSTHRTAYRSGCISLLLGVITAATLFTGPSAWAQDGHEAPAAAAQTTEHAVDAAHNSEEGEHHAADVNPLWMLPFVLLLCCIALMPLINPHFWEHKYPIFAGVFAVVGLCYYLLVRQDLHPWLHEMREYVSFICLLFALFVVSGGIAIHVTRKATPAANVTLLLIGAIIANIFGTTGASMLLIRPYIRINKHHIKPYHIVFFIFIIANAGGCLTPIGDPPLFLGYLKGVPFWWVLENCWQPWAVCVALLLGIFFVLDMRDHVKQERHDWGTHDTGPAVRINGMINFLFILVVILAVFRPSVFDAIGDVMNDGVTPMGLLGIALSREVLMVAAALASLRFTHKGIHEVNEFKFAPIREVALLFVAIFSTMVPALEYLDANAHKMPLKTPGHFYYATGTLSSVLDNAPTYLTFLQTRLGEIPPEQVQAARETLLAGYKNYVANPNPAMPVESYLPPIDDPQVIQAVMATVQYHREDIREGEGHVEDAELKLGFLIGVPELNAFLIAISIGAVFFGAMTYIGNAPNFMVKSIAESSGIKMPTFLGYVFKYALPILVPVYVLIWWIFLMPR